MAAQLYNFIEVINFTLKIGEILPYKIYLNKIIFIFKKSIWQFSNKGMKRFKERVPF